MGRVGGRRSAVSFVCVPGEAGMTIQVVGKYHASSWCFGSIRGPAPFGTSTQGCFPVQYVRRNKPKALL